MSDTLSHQFIAAMENARDRLFALALGAEGSPAKAEARLYKTASDIFAEFGKSPHMDVLAAFEQTLISSPAPDAPMPADVWARLAASIQIEAARSAHSKALNPDSVLLSPDPLLAPKKSAGHDSPEGFDLPGPSRFLIGSIVVIVIGILLTIYIVTRPSGEKPTTQPATITSEPAR